MSEEKPVGLTFAEKLFGIIIFIIGFILTYYTYINQGTAGIGAWFFIAGGVSLMILGLIMLIAKAG